MKKFFKEKIFSRSGFFWTVNIIFMAVSVIHAGVFFGITGNGHDIPGVAQYLGFAVSFFLDLVTIILMQALLEAKYRSDEPRAKQFLLFITICCSTSTFANLAISLNDFNAAKELPNAPLWIQIAAPYVLASFPLFVILMSVAAEMIVNVRPLDSLNADEYEADEQKRIALLRIRNDYLQRQSDEEMRTLQIRSQMQMNKRLRSGRMSKSFRWFWEKPVDIDAVLAGVSTQLKAVYEPQIEQLKQRLEAIQKPVIQPSIPAIEQPESPAPKVDDIEPNTTLQISLESEEQTQDDNDLSGILEAYPKVANEWLAKNRKSVTLDEIITVTGHSKRKLNRVVFARSSRNKDLILVSSVLEWLKSVPKPDQNVDKTEPKPQNTDELNALSQSNGHHKKDTQPLDLVELEV